MSPKHSVIAWQLLRHTTRGQDLITTLTIRYQKHSLLPRHFSGRTDRKYGKSFNSWVSKARASGFAVRGDNGKLYIHKHIETKEQFRRLNVTPTIFKRAHFKFCPFSKKGLDIPALISQKNTGHKASRCCRVTKTHYPHARPKRTDMGMCDGFTDSRRGPVTSTVLTLSVPSEMQYILRSKQIVRS